MTKPAGVFLQIIGAIGLFVGFGMLVGATGDGGSTASGWAVLIGSLIALVAGRQPAVRARKESD